MSSATYNACPSCRSTRVARCADDPRFYECLDCGRRPLLRMPHESRLGWTSFYYVDPHRESVEVHRGDR